MNWIITILLLGGAAASEADVFVIGTGHYRMSDRDSDAEAQQIAFQRALARAREQAGPLHVSSQTSLTVTEWGSATRHEQFDQQMAVRSSAQLRLISKVAAPVEEAVHTSVRLGDRTVYVVDRVRYWTCAVRVQVVQTPMGAPLADALPGPEPHPSAASAANGPANSRETEPSPWPQALTASRGRMTTGPATGPQRVAPAAHNPARSSSPQGQLFSAGLAQVLRGDWHLARDLFGQVLRRDPTHGDALYLLAFCLERSGDHQAFRQVLGRAVRSHPHKSIYGVLNAQLPGDARQALAL
jgi:hypothetical protein